MTGAFGDGTFVAVKGPRSSQDHSDVSYESII